MLRIKNKITPTFSSQTAPIKHIAFIMDGNGRWAKKRNLPDIAGHRKGVEIAREITKYASEKGISYITLYTFSTENWKRSEGWINDFMGLLRWYLQSQIKDLMENGVKLQFIGDLSRFAPDLQEMMRDASEKTKTNTRITVVLALNYGGRDEILRMVKNISSKVKSESISVDDISLETITNTLDTHGIPDPDLLIRTSGEQRISNYLLWQLAYTEFVFNDKLWPDYTIEDFEKDLQYYGSRQRRYGG